MARTTAGILTLTLIMTGVLESAPHPEHRTPQMHNPSPSAPSTDVATPDPAGFAPAPVASLASQPPARLIVDSPLPEQLAMGRVVIRYRTENIRIVQVFGAAALDVSPRIGHLHITVDDAPWHWLDASGEPIVINGFSSGQHKILFELADANHAIIDSTTINFDVPQRPAAHP